MPSARNEGIELKDHVTPDRLLETPSEGQGILIAPPGIFSSAQLKDKLLPKVGEKHLIAQDKTCRILRRVAQGGAVAPKAYRLKEEAGATERAAGIRVPPR